MTANEIISCGKLIYSSTEKDENLRTIAFMKKSSSISYYTCHPLSQVDEVFLGLLESEGSLPLTSLGTILGFDVIDSPQEDHYFDEAEYNLFTGLLEEVESWGLVRNENKTIQITELGRLALSTGKKYRFFSKEIDYFNFLNLTKDKKEIDDYPFSAELGCNLDLSNGRRLPYTDELVNSVVSKPSSALINKISLQVNSDVVISEVIDRDFFSPGNVFLPVNLYSYNDQLYLVFFYQGEPCVNLFELIEAAENKKEKEIKIEWALLYQILNDPAAILSYSNLGRFSDILEIKKLIPDKRLQWSDTRLLKLIISKCTGNDWHNLSHYCDCDVLKTLLDKYEDVLDWNELTVRMDEEFISATSKKYPWERNSLFIREPIQPSLVCQFLDEYDFPEGKDDGVWEWEDVIPLVGLDFIKDHIRSIPFNLFGFTQELDETDWTLVSDNPEARWNWYHVSKSFSLSFIHSNFDSLAPYINLETLLGRVFTDNDAIREFTGDPRLYETLSQLFAEESSRFSVNAKNYIWNDTVISFLESLHLLSWPSGVYSPGFEVNRYLQWDSDFFSKYYKRVTTDNGFSHVSSSISDTSLVDRFPDFNWDYSALSANKAVYTDFAFITTHKDKIDARVLLQNALRDLSGELDSLYGLFDIKELLDSVTELRSTLTENASVDYVRNNITYSWDWLVLTKRLCPQLKIENIGKERWADKWDWDYLSQSRELDDILAYAVDYKKHWNWELVLDRLNGDDILERDLLQTLCKAFSGLEKHDALCSLVTQKYSKDTLLELTSHNGKRDAFDWDFSYLYSLPDFSAKDYLDKHLDDVQWEAFSRSNSVNEWFSKTGKGKTLTLWIQIYKQRLNEEKYHWDFQGLSTLGNLLKQPHLFEIEKDWDWEYVSEHAPWVSFEPKKDFFLKKYQKTLSYKALSKRVDIGLTEAIVSKLDKKVEWDWDALTNNPSIVFSFDFINTNPDKPWNWSILSGRKDLSSEVISANKDKPWNWPLIVSKDWFIPTKEVMEIAATHIDDDSWRRLSNNENLTLDVVDKFSSFIDWRVLVVQNKAFDGMISVDFLKRHQDLIPWNSFNSRIKEDITSDLVDAFSDRLDWHYVSRSQRLRFTPEFVKKYEELWHWSELCENMKVRKLIPDFDKIFYDRTRSAVFVNRLKREVRKPYIYHFTHLFNAIDVIQSRKILSRDRAEELGLLKFDSAGSVISRSTKAHKYARFYFRPCTPTQYYNEALGADSMLGSYNKRGEWKSKYPGAFRLGLPKCPVPVFFRFDLEEVLSVMGDKCFYSDRNMQSDAPQIYSVLSAPEHLMTAYLYSTMEDAFNTASRLGGYDRDRWWSIFLMESEKFKKYSQQEFLVDTEFDFSKLKNFEIICYNEQYAQLLRTLLGDDPICERISSRCDEHIFERENRSVDYKEQDGFTSVSSNFRDEHYYLVKSQNLNRIELSIAPEDVIAETSKSIKLKGPVKWHTTLYPLQVFFVDPNARTKEWLVYENMVSQEMEQSVSSLITNKMPLFLNTMDSISLKLTKDLFYQHMISSYHGIGHTARVVYYSYLLASGIEGLTQNEIRACCIAAIIHDLGKTSDREGSIHGYNSMELYKEKLAEYIADNRMIQRVLNAVRYHSVDDRDCPDYVIDDVITKVLKDADALDRSRFGGRGCDRSYLRLALYDSEYGESILKIADFLPALTERCDWEDPYNEIVESISKIR